MDIAVAKRKENIAEYILYLWQLEDLLRAMQFSPEAIYATLIAPRKDLSEEQKPSFLIWYMDIANLLREEGKAKAVSSGLSLLWDNSCLQETFRKSQTMPLVWTPG